MPIIDATEFHLRLARLVLKGEPFISDDVTSNGEFAFDEDHRVGGRQTRIGGFMSGAQDRGIIAWTGEIATSRSPYRHGGLTKVWRGTDRGRKWARAELNGQ